MVVATIVAALSVGSPSVQEALHKWCTHRAKFPGTPRQKDTNAFNRQHEGAMLEHPVNREL